MIWPPLVVFNTPTPGAPDFVAAVENYYISVAPPVRILFFSTTHYKIFYNFFARHILHLYNFACVSVHHKTKKYPRVITDTAEQILCGHIYMA